MTDFSPTSDAAKIEQRPNTVIDNGGALKIRGMMLPLPPSSNAYWRNLMMVAKGTTFPFVVHSMKELYKKVRLMSAPTEESKDYIELIKETALQKDWRFFSDKPIKIDIVVCPRDRRVTDAHNYGKVFLDALEKAGVYENDSQVMDVRIRMGPVIKGGRIVFSLWEVEYDRDAVFREAWG